MGSGKTPGVIAKNPHLKDVRMNDLKLKRKEIKDENGDTIRLVYNETEDILDVFFNENEPATGIELTDHILLRLDKKTGRAISLTLLHFSILMEIHSMTHPDASS